MSKKKITPHPVSLGRSAAGWSQAELAERAGIPRTTLSAIESRRLTPSVAAAIALARALGSRVEALFSDPARTAIWAFEPRGNGVRFCTATVGDRLLHYPVESLAATPFPHDGISSHGADLDPVGSPALAGETLVLACCDPAAGLLGHALARAAGIRLLVLERGGLASLDLLRKGLVHLAGLHFSTAADPDRNRVLVRRELGEGYSLVRAASWEEGLVRPASERRASTSALIKRDRTWALREPGSAARDCFDQFLGKKKSPKGRVVAGHAAVATSIRDGWADAGVCVRLSAAEAGLAFQPLRTEQLDFCLAEDSLSDPRVKSLLRVLRSREHRRVLDELPGYDARETGEILAS